MTYTFMEKGQITLADVQRIIDLTEAGTLRWHQLEDFAALVAQPELLETDEWTVIQFIGMNMSRPRIGFNPSNGEWHYFRMMTDAGEHLYVEEGSDTELMELTSRLYGLVQKAIRLGGILQHPEDEERLCSKCDKKTPHRALVDRPHGLAGAEMGGSRRHTCVVCETSTPMAQT